MVTLIFDFAYVFWAYLKLKPTVATVSIEDIQRAKITEDTNSKVYFVQKKRILCNHKKISQT